MIPAIITIRDFMRSTPEELMALEALVIVASIIIIASNARNPLLNPTNLFSLIFVVMAAIGAPIAGDTASMRNITPFSYVCFSLGVATVAVAVETARVKHGVWLRSAGDLVDRWSGLAWWLVFTACMSVTLLMTFYHFKTYGIVFLADNINAARIEAGQGGTYSNHFVGMLFPFFLVILYSKIYIRPDKPDAVAWIMAASLLLLGVAVLALTGFRASIAHFVIAIMVIHNYASSRRLNMKKLIAITFAVSVLLVISTSLRWGIGLTEAFFHLVARVTLVNQENINFIMDYTDKHGLFWGETYWMDLKTAMPGPDVGFRRMMTIARNPDMSVESALTPTIIGESYANYGYFGTIALMYLMGLAYQIFTLWTVTRQRDLVFVSYIGMLSILLAKIATQGLSRPFIVFVMPLSVVYMAIDFASRYYLPRMRFRPPSG